MSHSPRAAPTAEGRTINRWLVAGMGTLLQLCLGTVYAWSFFQKPIMDTFGWNNTQVAWIFSLAICTLGLTAAWGGINLPKFGPTKLAMIGGALYGIGHMLSAFAMSQQSLVLFYIAYGIICGIGLGLGYVTPVATAAKWFPDKKGLVTGMVVMGFGFGALVMSKVIAPGLMSVTDNNLVKVFFYIGIIMLVLATAAGSFMRNPPAGYVPPGWTPPAATAASKAADDALTAKDCVLSGRFAAVWILLFTNVTAGIMFIGFQSPMLQDLLHATGKYAGMEPETATALLAASGATLIGISSLFNGIGRFFWGGLSDKIGRVQTFRFILGSQIVVFTILLFVGNPWIFGALVCYILLCYGGGFGTAPSTVLTIFGARLMPVVYGFLLTAWSAGGIAGPQIAAVIKDKVPENASTATFSAAIAVLVLGLVTAFFINDKPFQKKA